MPGGNLFPTVRTRQPTGKRVYLSIKRVCLPTSLQIYNRMRISADRSIERRPTVRLYQTLAPYYYYAGTTLPPTTDRADVPTIYKTTGSANTPATTTNY